MKDITGDSCSSGLAGPLQAPGSDSEPRGSVSRRPVDGEGVAVNRWCEQPAGGKSVLSAQWMSGDWALLESLLSSQHGSHTRTHAPPTTVASSSRHPPPQVLPRVDRQDLGL
ncbi:hypothetical protein E2C01_066406 [Portunus trituberculatus]|uniref:Uncharacterized protein n=1 Tax=Portunus trituberculatus TaxID=210409 RepID=A0A5B7HLF1_PORTR|nr:hypothetical protein [Portunus trituberculatus]